MKPDSSELFEIINSKGKKIPAKKFFLEVEKLFSKNFDKYSKNILPLSLMYCGDKNPFESLMFSVGILSGYVISKKKYKIKCKKDISFPTVIFRMLYDLRKRVDES